MQILNDIFNECKVFIQEEYNFRKSFLENPEQLFLKLIKREGLRPDLWSERIGDEMEISLEKQHEIIRKICFKALTLLHNTLKGEKNELVSITFPVFYSASWADGEEKSLEKIIKKIKKIKRGKNLGLTGKIH